MRPRLPLPSRLTSVFGAIALVAIIMRGLIPAGYMIAAPGQTDGLISIEICHGGSGETGTLLLDPRTGDLVDPDDLSDTPEESDGQACPFALSAHFAIPAQDAQASQPVQYAFYYQTAASAGLPGRGLAAPPPPSRAPPVPA